MSATETLTQPTPPAPSRRRTIAVWSVQLLVGAFFVVASAVPKLAGEAYAVQIFDDIGAGQWLRYLVGVVELAGGVGLMVPRLAGLAASGLIALMVGATFTQLAVLHAPLYALTPVILAALLGVVARFHWPRTRAAVAAALR